MVARDTVLHRVSGERLIVLGWSRAILMQLSHPLMAAGVARHSTFRGRATEAAVRLHHTVGAMLSLLFETGAARAQTIAHIRSIHTTVNGTLGASAGPFQADSVYSAEDPALLRWVHLTLLDSSAIVYERLVAPLSPSDLDLICENAAPTLLDLGGDPATVPRTWPDVVDGVRQMIASGALVVTPEAREVAMALLSPRAARVPIPFIGWHRLIAIGLLPPAIRRAYGFKWDAAREARLARVLNIIRSARRITPDVIALWPQAR